MVEAGSDWDRKNRLKVYEATYLMSIRNFKRAAQLLLEGISTFTALELMDYSTFIFYTVLVSVVALDRVTLKNKVRCVCVVCSVVCCCFFTGG
jgi:26S proteasome regulatory subunit N7